MSILWLNVLFRALALGAATPAATGEVQVLTASNFSTSIREGMEQPWFVEFYSPHCGHCKRLASVWEQLAKQLEGKVAVAKVDATYEESLADEWDVTGYPTLVLVAGGKRYDFRGGRSLEALKSFALGGYLQSQEPSTESSPAFGGEHVLSLSGDMEEVVRSSAKAMFIVFYLRGCGHCRSMESTWGSLALELKDQVQVASLDAQQFRPLTELWRVERFPTMKLVAGNRVYDFEGDREVEDLKAFALKGFSALPGEPLPPRLSDLPSSTAQPGGAPRSNSIHLAVGFGLGMVCAAAAWAMCTCLRPASPASSKCYWLRDVADAGLPPKRSCNEVCQVPRVAGARRVPKVCLPPSRRTSPHGTRR